MKEYFDKAFEELYPGYVPGDESYDFKCPWSKADVQRMIQVGDSMERSFNRTDVIEISNDVCHFVT